MLSVCHIPTPSNIAEDSQAKEKKKKEKKKKRSAKGKNKKKKRISKKKHCQAIDTKIKQAEIKKPKDNT